MFCIRDDSCLVKNAQPVIAFVTFFQSNLHLIDKICSAGSIVCFMNVCADACPAAEQLWTNGCCLSTLIDVLTETDDINRKGARQVDQLIISHKTPLQICRSAAPHGPFGQFMTRFSSIHVRRTIHAPQGAIHHNTRYLMLHDAGINSLSYTSIAYPSVMPEM